jgi:hypothetical protein
MDVKSHIGAIVSNVFYSNETWQCLYSDLKPANIAIDEVIPASGCALSAAAGSEAAAHASATAGPTSLAFGSAL